MVVLSYQAGPLLLYLLLSTCTSCLVQSLGFKWEASMKKNGMAQSLERSSFGGKKSYGKEILEKAKVEFTNYPQFLARKNVLLGLFTSQTKHHGREDETTQICDFLFGLNLLTFGKVETSTFRKIEEDRESGCNIKSEGVVARIPVVGGLLACQPNNDASDSASLGQLTFQLTQTARSKESKSEETNLQIMETRVVDYKPAIAGKAPVNFLRKSLYLNSQSYFHAYVMWRFHGHCSKTLAP